MNWIKSERFHPVGHKLQIIFLLLHNARQGLCIRVTLKFRDDDYKIKGKKSALMRKLFSPPNNSELHKNVNLIVSTLLSCVQRGKAAQSFSYRSKASSGSYSLSIKFSENSYCNTFNDVLSGIWGFLFASHFRLILIVVKWKFGMLCYFEVSFCEKKLSPIKNEKVTKKMLCQKYFLCSLMLSLIFCIKHSTSNILCTLNRQNLT